MTDLPVTAELCLIRPKAATATDVLTLLAERAVAMKYAHPSFGPALIAREAAFPTGLPTPVPIAIPHTDVQHVLRPALVAALLDPPVPFGEMGAVDGKVVDVRVAVALLVTDPAAQVPLLVKVLSAAQGSDWAKNIDLVDTPADLADTLSRALGASTTST